MKLVELNLDPTDRQLRQFGAIAAVALPMIFGVWALLGRVTWNTVGVAAAIGISLAIVGLPLPRVIKPVFLLLTVLTFPIGLVVSEVVLFAIYLFVFLPIGLVFRLMGRDSMRLSFDRNAGSYWQSKKQPAGAASYYRQS